MAADRLEGVVHGHQLADPPVEVGIVALHDRESAAPSDRRDLYRRSGERQRAAAAVHGTVQQVERIHAATLRVAAVLRVALAEREGDRVGSDALIQERRRRHGSRRCAYLHEVARLQAERLRRCRMHLHPGVPHGLGDRVRQLLHPGAVRSPTIVELRRGESRERQAGDRLGEVELVIRGRRGQGRRQARFIGTAADCASLQQLEPEVLEWSRAGIRLRIAGSPPRLEPGFPVLHFERTAASRSCDRQQHILCLARVEQRAHDRLGHGPDSGPDLRVAPRFQLVVRGEQPVRCSGRFIEMRAD
jgi:hypothetical protein